MHKNKIVDQSYNYAISQIFAPSFLKKIAEPYFENNFRSLLVRAGLHSEKQKWNLSKGLEIAYSHLKNNYRCEYVYKNEIANQLLLKFHNDNSATLLKELNSDNSIADIVIINGNTVAYEIKTELDNLDRLRGQTHSYQSLYDYLYVVTHHEAVKKLELRLCPSVGIIVLDSNSELKTIRTAKLNDNLFNPAKAASTIRQSELVSAYEKYVGKLPPMGTALIHSFCCNWYLSLDKEDAHIIFAESLKSRRPSKVQFDLIRLCDAPLKILFMGKTLPKKYCHTTMGRFNIFV